MGYYTQKHSDADFMAKEIVEWIKKLDTLGIKIVVISMDMGSTNLKLKRTLLEKYGNDDGSITIGGSDKVPKLFLFAVNGYSCNVMVMNLLFHVSFVVPFLLLLHIPTNFHFKMMNNDQR